MPTFYRVVKNSPPMLQDFTSAQAQGRTLRDPDLERQRLWAGISANATLGQAKSRARDYPALGRYVARLALPEGGPIRYERTLRRSRGHYTLWGDPALLLHCVTAVVPVDE